MSIKLYRNKNHQAKKGFTLVELSLAVAFIALLLIIMATLIMSLISIYRKGITVNSVNFVGRSIIEDFQNSISESEKSQNPESVCSDRYADKLSTGYIRCEGDEAKNLIYDEVYNGSGEPLYGAFCTGSYSYLWNTGYAIKNGGRIKYNGANFKLLKIYDTGRTICGKFVDDNYGSIQPGSISTDITDKVELIEDSDTKLALYHVYVSTPATTTGSKRAFFSGSFILATETGGVSIMSSGNYCKPPGDNNPETNFDYCAINKFNFAVQGNGG